MSESQFLSITISLVATLFGILILIVGWLGSKVYIKLDEMSKTMRDMTLELHDRIGGIDRRLVRVEDRVLVDRRGS